MKKEKRKFLGSITSYILAFICITSWVALGVVLALTSANISIGGNISFTATDVYADVTGTVTGTATTNTLEDIHITADTTNFTTPSSWSNINFDFVKGQDIVFTINITNKSTERSLWVSFTDAISATNTTITRKSAGTTVSAFDTLEVEKSTSKSVEITLHITNSNESVSGTFNLGLNLMSKYPAKDASEYENLSFIYNNTAKTAIVGRNSSNKPTGELIIPSTVIHNGEEYTITSIGSSESGFGYCTELTSITIPSSVTIISTLAFQWCTSLTSITIPSSVTSIESCAFEDCSSLTSAIFENTTGWKAGDTVLSSSELANTSTAATHLTTTYVNNDWTRS